MNRSDNVLVALSAGGRGSRFNAIQPELLLFLIDREIADAPGGPQFDFEPYLVGPHDPAVFKAVDSLEAEGKAIVDRGSPPFWEVSVSEAGSRKWTGADRDAAAIASDWRTVGDDLRFTMQQERPGGAP